MATKPSTIPAFDTNATRVSAPSGAETTDGWINAQEPTSSVFNWFFYWVYKWIYWLDSVTSSAIVPRIGLLGVDSVAQVNTTNGLNATGLTTGAGVNGTGGATGIGVIGNGGATSGDGVNGISATAGVALRGVATGSGAGVVGDSSGGTGNGAILKGNATKAPLAIGSQAQPSSPVEGDVYEDSTTHTLFYYNGTVWVSLAAAPLPIKFNNTVQVEVANTEVVIAGGIIGGINAPNFQSLIPADGFALGTQVHAEFNGNEYSSNAGDTFTVNVRIGPTGTVSDTIVAQRQYTQAGTPSDSTPAWFKLILDLQLQNIGSSAHFYSAVLSGIPVSDTQATLINNGTDGSGSSGFVDKPLDIYQMTAPHNFNSTINNYITVTAVTSAATTKVSINTGSITVN